jgi:hypothetical protein
MGAEGLTFRAMSVLARAAHVEAIAPLARFRQTEACCMQFLRPFRLILLILGTSPLGCTNVLGYDEISFEEPPAAYVGPSSSQQCGIVPVPSLSCAQCINEACCSSASACGENRACALLARCRLTCDRTDLVCLHNCGIDHFGGIPTWQTLHQCEDQSCAEACSSGDS